MKTVEPVVWTEALANAVSHIAADASQSADVRSRALEMKAARPGQGLEPHQVEFVTCLRQRVEPSTGLEALERAWAEAWSKANPVRANDWTGHACTLVDQAGEPATAGQLVSNGEGGTYVLKGGVAPHKYGSSGRVWVYPLGAPSRDTLEYYPSVFGLRWVA